MVQTEEGGYQPRTDLKPLHVVQPEGVSFKMNGHILEWQNWKMHVGKYALRPFINWDDVLLKRFFVKLSRIEKELLYLPSPTMIMVK